MDCKCAPDDPLLDSLGKRFGKVLNRVRSATIFCCSQSVKLLVFAHRLEFGGTQVNAVELCAALRDLCGHQVALFATPGPMLELAQAKGLRFIPAPDASAHPSPARMAALHRVLQSEKPDLLHAWDWPQCLDAYYVATMLHAVPMLVTDMSMVLSRFLPKSVPTTFGTPQLVAQARRLGRRPVELLVPPVDVHVNAPGAADGAAFRAGCGIAADEIVLVTVSRLTAWMKAEGIQRTIDVVRRLGRELPLRFVIVGDGDARSRMAQLAAQVNGELGRLAVLLPGAMTDPRGAYAAADVVLGMGGSALRAMAFAKPVMMLGESGFSSPFTPLTAETFYDQGMYGIGHGDPGNAQLLGNLQRWFDNLDQLPAIGAFSRQFVVERFSLDGRAADLSRFMLAAAAAPPPLPAALGDGLRTATLLLSRRLVPNRMRRLIASR